jgi:hypothetical protein
MADAPPRDLVEWLDYYLVKKAPFQIPEAGRRAIVQFGPWVIVILIILTLPQALYFFGWHRWFWHGDWFYVPHYRFASLLSLVACGLMFLALPGLFNRRKSGWSLLFYAQLLSAIISVAFLGNIIGGLIGALVGLYVLFQVRGHYS